MAIQHEWEMEHVPHSIYIRPLNTYDVWPYDPNHPFTLPYIQEINTFDDWRIVPTSRPVINPPVYKENYLDVPGTYGSLDYSRAHTGLPIYGNRTGSWEFVVLNDYRPWEQAYSDIQHCIHGKRCIVVLEDDLEHFYVGTLKVNQWRSDPGWSRIVIDYNFEPFKYAKEPTVLETSVNADAVLPGAIHLSPTLLGDKPDFPWVKITPRSDTDDVRVSVMYTNMELLFLSFPVITVANKFTQNPEFILSNENGVNEVDILFYSSEDVDITVQYYRRYL